MPRPSRALLPVVLLACLILAGCEPDATRITDGAVRIESTEYRIRPQNISVPEGRVTFVVVNTGRLIHNVAIRPVSDDPDEAVPSLARTKSLHPGETSRPFTLDLKPGKYLILCTIANHDDLGEYGWLYVTSR